MAQLRRRAPRVRALLEVDELQPKSDREHEGRGAQRSPLHASNVGVGQESVNRADDDEEDARRRGVGSVCISDPGPHPTESGWRSGRSRGAR
jgi:hypothetical protein